MDPASGRREWLRAVLFLVGVSFVQGHVRPFDCQGVHGPFDIRLEAIPAATDSQAACTGYVNFQGAPVCGGMDCEAAQRLCYERGYNMDGENRAYRCDFFTDASLDDAAADTDYAILPGIDTYSGYACPNIGPDSCFADCYFDAGDTIIQDTGTGAVNCPGDQKQTAVICTDIDECQEHAFRNCTGPFDFECCRSPPCGPHALCENTIGSYTCTCPPNWDGPGSNPYDLEIGCIDTDECDDSFHICGFDTDQCENVPGSYVCICGAGKYWDPEEPRPLPDRPDEPGDCVAESCQAPPSDPFGTLDSADSEYPGTATVSCDAGYTPSFGSVDDVSYTVNCRTDGKWCSCSGPTCKRTKCPSPGFDVNAVMEVGGSGKGVFEDTTTYTCKPGFETPSKATTYTTECQSNGLWSIEPGCLDINECTSVVDACPDDSVCYNTVGSYYCVCNPGFTGSGVVGTPCTRITCGIIPNIFHSEQTTLVGYALGAFGDRVEYRCDNGYHSTQTHDLLQFTYTITIECRADGVWEPYPLPECIPIYCGDPGSKAFSERHGGSFYFNDEVAYSCCEGFRPSNVPWNVQGNYLDIVIHCQESGYWSQGGTCEDIDECVELDKPCGRENHVCINTPGSYRCACNYAYREDAYGQTCEPFPDDYTYLNDACNLYNALHVCPYGRCEVVDGKARCQCQDGYYGQFCGLEGEEFSDTLNGALLLGIVSWALCGLLIILVVIVCIMLCSRPNETRRRRRRRKPQNEVVTIQQAAPTQELVQVQQAAVVPQQAVAVPQVLAQTGGTYAVYQ